jgi:hypothetical protein
MPSEVSLISRNEFYDGFVPAYAFCLEVGSFRRVFA